MNRISTNFSYNKFSDLALLGFSNEVVLRMTGNPNFPMPSPSISRIKSSIDEFEAALSNTAEGTKADTEFKNRCRSALVAQLKLLAVYVEGIANGDRLILLSSGFSLWKEPSLISEIDEPENIRISAAEGKGTLLITCNTIDHARYYEVQFAPTPVNETTGSQSTTSTKSKVLISGLVSGKEYAVRLSGVTSNQLRKWSPWHTSFVL